MKAVKREVLNALKTLTRSSVQRKSEEWPPACFGLLHQPKRPKHK